MGGRKDKKEVKENHGMYCVKGVIKLGLNFLRGIEAGKVKGR